MTPKTQKALVSPTPRAPWELRTDWPVPAPGPKELLIKVVAAALNPADWRVQTSGIIPFVTYPFLGGLDGAGIIEEVGTDVTGFAKGDKVYVVSFFSMILRLKFIFTGYVPEDLAHPMRLSSSITSPRQTIRPR